MCMMELKIPAELFSAIEGKQLIHKITKDTGTEMDYKKGQRLILRHDDTQILDLACDTMKFWVSDDTKLKDNMICLLEDKKVVWKFDGTYARKVLHLFEGNLGSSNLGNVTIRKNNKKKKNVSLLEIYCSYPEFRNVDPKIGIICKGVEKLVEKQINVKQSDRIKARKFVEDKLDNDNTVLCIFNEKELILEIFAKSDEMIAKAEREFNQDSIKMTGRGKKNTEGFATKTTTMFTTANTIKEQRPTVMEGTHRDMNDSVSTNSVTKSSSQRNSSSTEFKTDMHLAKSVRKAEENKSVVAISYKKTSGPLQDSVGGQVTDMKMTSLTDIADKSGKVLYTESNSSSGGAMAKQYSPGATVGTGSRFRYEFALNGLKVVVYRESIVDIKGVDAIVNAANEHMVHGGGVAYYISKAAGGRMDDEGRAYVARYGKVNVGDNCVTCAGRLPFEGIIHAVGPQWSDYVGKEDLCAKDLYITIKNTLKRAKEYKWRRIALCAVSAGIYGVPKDLCAEMYIKALVDFSQIDAGSLAEVHFVDINLEILGSIKDAHERWCKSPNCLEFKNAFKYPSASGRQPSNTTSYLQSTSQKTMKESSAVKYAGQSKTKFDGGPVYAFMICGALRVQIYKGNIIKVNDVDAIVCSVNNKFSGGLAKVVAQEGGHSYQADLMNVLRQRKKTPYNGEVFITRGGSLRVQKVLHVVIMKPIESVNGEALSRLKVVNQGILKAANISMFRRLAIPLIGAGALQCQKDIAACCQRFAEDVIEFCKINLTRLRIEEIHIVNQDESRSRLMCDTFRQLDSQSSTQLDASSTYQTRRTHDMHDMSGRFTSSERQAGETTEKTFKLAEPEKNKHTSFWTPLGNTDIRCTYYESCKQTAGWSLMCGHMFCDVCKVPIEKSEKCYKCQVPQAEKEDKDDKQRNTEEETDENCPVCLTAFTNPSTLPCGHQLCKPCLDQVKKHKPSCPICNKAFDVITGTQPGGRMVIKEIKDKMPGFESCNAIEIFYDFPDGKQGPEHPKPGRPYKGTQRRAFLPNNKEGKIVLKLLQVAFDRHLTFTIGDSRTTGKEDQVTWNDIHHKTNIHGGAQKFGFPDPDYLSRVKEELAAKGVTEEDL